MRLCEMALNDPRNPDRDQLCRLQRTLMLKQNDSGKILVARDLNFFGDRFQR